MWRGQHGRRHWPNPHRIPLLAVASGGNVLVGTAVCSCLHACIPLPSGLTPSVDVGPRVATSLTLLGPCDHTFA